MACLPLSRRGFAGHMLTLFNSWKDVPKCSPESAAPTAVYEGSSVSTSSTLLIICLSESSHPTECEVCTSPFPGDMSHLKSFGERSIGILVTLYSECIVLAIHLFTSDLPTSPPSVCSVTQYADISKENLCVHSELVMPVTLALWGPLPSPSPAHPPTSTIC